MNESDGDARAVAAAVDRLADGIAAPAEVRGELRVVAYRLLFTALVHHRGGRLAPLDAVREVPLAQRLPEELLTEVADSLHRIDLLGHPDVPVALGAVHQQLLAAEQGGARKRAGSYFTPGPLVEHLLDEALEPALDEAADPFEVSVLDPACGSGLFLVAAARRIARRGCGGRTAVRAAIGQVHGIDLDPGAVELARICLWLELVEPGRTAEMPELGVRVGDALLDEVPVAEHDVVIGNPPFLNQLERLTATARDVAGRLNERAGGVLRPYTDISAVFLHRSLEWTRDGGRLALVQPQSLLAARDAAGVRRHLAERCALESLWGSEQPVFDAHVLTCAPVLRKGAEQGLVRRTHGPRFDPVAPHRVDGELHGEWSFLLAAGLGIPQVHLAEDHGVLADLAECTADFRDQYYGLAGAVHEAPDCPDGAPLVTTGLIEPAECRWGMASTRFLKQRWERPVVDLAALHDEAGLARWATARLVPKVLVATQGKVIEAVVDEDGAWLPSVPTITVAAPRDRLWHLLAVLLAPPVSAYAAGRYAGTALTMRAIKLSARQVAALPLPGGREAWDAAAVVVERAQRDSEHRADHLVEAGRLMCAAYGVEESAVLPWWLTALRR